MRKGMWNDGDSFVSELTDPWAPHPVVNRLVCNKGGGKGGGIGSALGTILGAVLAPETFGLSLPLGAAIGGGLGGVGGNLIQDAVTGQWVKPLDVLTSGAIGAGTGYLGGQLGSAAGLGGALGGGATEAAAPAASIVDAAGGAGPAFLGGATPLGAVGTEGAVAGLGGGSAAAAADPFGVAGTLGGVSGIDNPQQLYQLTGGVGFGQGDVALPGGITPAAAPGSSAPALTGISPGEVVPADALSGWSAGAAPASISDAAASVGALPAPPVGDAVSGTGLFDTGGVLSDVGKWIGANKDTLGAGALAANIGKQLISPASIPGASTLSGNAQLAQEIARASAGRQPTTQIGGVGVDVPTQIAHQNAGATLTPAQQAASTQQLQGQIAAIRSKYAGLGMSGSTAEQRDINAAQTAQRAADAATIQNNQQLALSAAGSAGSTQLAQTGQQGTQAATAAATALSALGAANAPTIAIAQQQLADDEALQNAIAEAARWALYSQPASSA